MAKRWGRKKGAVVQFLEFVAVFIVYQVARMTPLGVGQRASRLLGNLAYYLAPKRRNIAIANLRHIFATTKSEQEIRSIARKSCCSVTVSAFEAVKVISTLSKPFGSLRIREAIRGLDLAYQRAKQLHQDCGGCIFVTPHLGNWEILPFVGSCAGIPAVVVVRPFDNKFLEQWLAGRRQASGQVFISRTNSMQFLQTSLSRGKSVSMLPDQSTMKSISVDYLGRKATTTPIPAILAIRYNRPIVVVACCRNSDEFRFEGFISDPIWPEARGDEQAEIFRLTEAMNREMGMIVQRYPEQYLWMHDRWKKYTHKREMSFAV